VYGLHPRRADASPAGMSSTGGGWGSSSVSEWMYSGGDDGGDVVEWAQQSSL